MTELYYLWNDSVTREISLNIYVRINLKLYIINQNIFSAIEEMEYNIIILGENLEEISVF